MTWPQIPLGELAQIDRIGIAPKDIRSGTSYVGLENIAEGGDLINVQPVSNGDLASTKFAFTQRHVLYGKLRPYLRKIARPGFEGICSTDILPILPGKTIDRDYLAHSLLLDSSISFAVTRSVGVNLPRISPSVLETLKIPLPPMEEQRRIAAILDQAEALRAKRRQAHAKLDTLTQSLFLEMFGDPISNPMRWESQPLENVTTKITDGEHLNPEFSPTGMPIVMAGNVLHTQVDIASAERVDWGIGERFRRKCAPELGDLLLVSRGATIGRLCAVTISDQFCLMGSVILIKPIAQTVHTGYLNALLKHPAMRASLYKASGSSAQQAIYLKDLKKMRCLVPPMEVQRKFTCKLGAINNSEALAGSSLEIIEPLITSLQHRAFRGEL